MQISDALATKYPKDERLSPSVESSTLRNAFYITPFVCVIGGGFFLATALFIQKDREKAEKITKGTVTWLEFHSFFFNFWKKNCWLVIYFCGILICTSFWHFLIVYEGIRNLHIWLQSSKSVHIIYEAFYVISLRLKHL